MGTVGIIFTIMELARELKSSFIDVPLEQGDNIKSITSMFKTLIDAEWDISLWGHDIDKISGILMDSGADLIILAHDFVKAFQKPKCNIASKTPVFTITGVGDPRLMGTWMRQGWHRDRPRYRLIDDTNDPYTPTIHWSKHEYWRAFVDNPMHWG